MLKKLILALVFSFIASSAWATCGAIPLTIKDASNASQNISSATAADGNCKTYVDADTGSQIHMDLGAVSSALTTGGNTDTPCTLPATATACTQIALTKALANVAGNPIPVIAGTLPSTQSPVATGATTKAQTDLSGNLYISPQQAGGALLSTSDPCGPQNTKIGAPINLTASGQVITGTASKKTYVCAIDVVPAAAQNIALVEGTGTTCATNIFGLAGGTTAATGWNFQLGGGIARGSGNGTVYSPSGDTNATAANVCLLIAGAGQVSGQISYVQQ